ncbi:hypothetical protein [Rhizobium sp. L245/93]|uniref:hypothetical protein n=1 Tax=Rhizobium sp. L245/93 TaxID=2819998 RepID=UPI001ADAB770|nr:hypothetical protein [Rhizobium sp. L245/93]MBO9170901.1 hypothetical protein [Rhizobium sp. L245/93]
MSNIFTSKDPAGAVVGQSGAIFAVLAAGAVNAHMSGLAAMRQARENSRSHQLRAQLEYAVDVAHIYADLAAEQAVELEQLRAENRRLSKVAKQHHDDLIALSRQVRA